MIKKNNIEILKNEEINPPNKLKEYVWNKKKRYKKKNMIKNQ